MKLDAYNQSYFIYDNLNLVISVESFFYMIGFIKRLKTKGILEIEENGLRYLGLKVSILDGLDSLRCLKDGPYHFLQNYMSTAILNNNIIADDALRNRMTRIYNKGVLPILLLFLRKENIDHLVLDVIFRDALLSKLFTIFWQLFLEIESDSWLFAKKEMTEIELRYGFNVNEMLAVYKVLINQTDRRSILTLCQNQLNELEIQIVEHYFYAMNQRKDNPETDQILDFNPNLVMISPKSPEETKLAWSSIFMKKMNFKALKKNFYILKFFERLHGKSNLSSIVFDLVWLKEYHETIFKSHIIFKLKLESVELQNTNYDVSLAKHMKGPMSFSPLFYFFINSSYQKKGVIFSKIQYVFLDKEYSFFYLYFIMNLKRMGSYQLEFFYDVCYFQALHKFLMSFVKSEKDRKEIFPESFEIVKQKNEQLCEMFLRILKEESIFQTFDQMSRNFDPWEQSICDDYITFENAFNEKNENGESDKPKDAKENLKNQAEPNSKYHLLDQKLNSDLFEEFSRKREAMMDRKLFNVFKLSVSADGLFKTIRMFGKSQPSSLYTEESKERLLLELTEFLMEKIFDASLVFNQDKYKDVEKKELNNHEHCSSNYIKYGAGIFILLVLKKLSKFSNLPTTQLRRHRAEILIQTDTLFRIIDKTIFLCDCGFLFKKLYAVKLFLMSFGIFLKKEEMYMFSDQIWKLKILKKFLLFLKENRFLTQLLENKNPIKNDQILPIETSVASQHSGDPSENLGYQINEWPSKANINTSMNLINSNKTWNVWMSLTKLSNAELAKLNNQSGLQGASFLNLQKMNEVNQNMNSMVIKKTQKKYSWRGFNGRIILINDMKLKADSKKIKSNFQNNYQFKDLIGSQETTQSFNLKYEKLKEHSTNKLQRKLNKLEREKIKLPESFRSLDPILLDIIFSANSQNDTTSFSMTLSDFVDLYYCLNDYSKEQNQLSHIQQFLDLYFQVEEIEISEYFNFNVQRKPSESKNIDFGKVFDFIKEIQGISIHRNHLTLNFSHIQIRSNPSSLHKVLKYLVFRECHGCLIRYH